MDFGHILLFENVGKVTCTQGWTKTKGDCCALRIACLLPLIFMKPQTMPFPLPDQCEEVWLNNGSL